VVDKEVVVLDVGGVSLGMMKVMPLFKAVNTVGSTYFPERTVHILVLNAPRVFASLWSIVRPWQVSASGRLSTDLSLLPSAVGSCKAWSTRARKRRSASWRGARSSCKVRRLAAAIALGAL
jgi:hypothetical protein